MTPAAQLGALLYERLNPAGPPNLDEVCRTLGLRIKEVDAAGFDGALICSKTAQKGIIALRRNIRERGRMRFTVAHEIGHFVIPQHRLLGATCQPDVIERFDKKLTPPEVEANEFAAEFLLPEGLLRQRLNLKEPSLAAISAVANEFETSLTATMYRCVDLTEAPCAMVWSQSDRTVWYHASGTFPFLLTLSDLPTPQSVAGRLFAGGEGTVDFVEIHPDAWLNRKDAERVSCLVEHSLRLPYYDAVLSFLWIVKMEPLLAGLDEDAEGRLPELNPEDFTLRRSRWPR